MRYIKRALPLIIIFLMATIVAEAQYFGRNKPQYKKFDFEVIKTPHFEIYHYLQDPKVLNGLAESSEKWYQMHQQIFKDTLLQDNPVLFYNNHADFQQTNAISSAIGVGTGGVTEALKNRVIMPLGMSAKQTDHVLGHELVHAFQYSMILNGDSTSLQSLANLPLWMVEGLAEYMSIGRVDAHTSMWMRDAVLNDDVPELKKLNNPKYFPYRWGQAFWAFVTGLQGDNIIKPLFQETGKYGLEVATRKVLGMSLENLSELWVSGMKNHYKQYLGDKKERKYGKKILSKENSGNLNISPAISPNGRYVIYYSEKDIFTLDLYLADARNGKIIRKVASTLRDGHLDAFSFIESAGTWSPRSKQFAFVAIAKGSNVLVIKDAEKGKTIEEISLKGVPAFSSPAWSPDGRHIVVTGLVNGQVDLYQVDIRTKKVTQLTNDPYAEMLPAFNSSGSRLAFSTDEISIREGRKTGRFHFNLAVMDMESHEIQHLNVFRAADNLNPVFDKSDDIIFVSNRDGFRNIYRYNIDSAKVYQLTDLLTGVSGITEFAPAISIGGHRDRLLYTHFYNGNYTIYEAEPKELLNKEVSPTAVNLQAATLPRINQRAPDIVDASLNNQAAFTGLSDAQITDAEYQPKFKLDFVTGGGGVGIGTNAIGSNTLLAGGVTLLFSDILGNNQLITSLALNGEIYDAGGQLAYINRKNRIGWGAGFSHIPYPSVSYPVFFEDRIQVSENTTIPAIRQSYKVQRVFEDRLDLFAQYPFSVTQRLEAGIAMARYSSRIDSVDNYYSTDPNYNFLGSFLGQEKRKIDAPNGFNLFNLSMAYVGDSRCPVL